jgi:proline iminopeptidase
MKIPVRGIELSCEMTGSGPPCVLVHGGPGMSHPNALARFAPLADMVQLIHYDQRGHGQSSRAPAETYTLNEQTEDLRALCGALGLDRPVVLGTSAGGFVSLLYAGRYPAGLRGLTLVGTSGSAGFMTRATSNMTRLGTPAMQQAYRALWDGSITDPRAFQRAFETILPLYYHDPSRSPSTLEGTQFDPDTRRAFIRDYPAYDARPLLGQIRVPTLIIAGRHDWICPVEESIELARSIPGAELHIFEHSGHSPQVEEADEFMAVVRRFLGRLPHPGGGARD